MSNKPITIQKLKELAAYEAPLCITLTMPCHISGDEQQQNPIRFKNLIQEASGKLEKIGKNQKEIDSLMAPLRKYYEQSDWKHEDRGLMVCICDEFCELYSLPFDVDINAIVDRHFYLRPVIPHMQGGQEFALLELCMDEPSLTYMSADGESEAIKPPKSFRSFKAYMGHFDMEESLQFRSPSHNKVATHAKPRAGFHGQGVAGDEATQKDHLREYFKQLENWVVDVMNKKSCKQLFLVAEAQMEGMFKNVMHENKTHMKLTTLAQKNPQSEKTDMWITLAREYMQGDQAEQSERALAEFARMKDTDGDSVKEDISDIVKAACNHRIDTLMIPNKSQDYHWGRYDNDNSTVHKQTKDESESGAGDELVNLAVIKTFLNGGRIVPVDKDEGQSYAAICRW